MRACNKEVRLAAQVHEGDARAERRGRGARMDASGRATPGLLDVVQTSKHFIEFELRGADFPLRFFFHARRPSSSRNQHIPQCVNRILIPARALTLPILVSI